MLRWLAIALLASCYQPTPPEGAPCTTSEQCPSSLVCDNGTCRREPGAEPDSALSDGKTADDAQPDDALVIDSQSTCDVVTGEFQIALLDDLDSLFTDGGPTLHQTELIFHSERTGGVGFVDLYVTTGSATQWAAPQPITELDTTADETNPEISADGRTLYFSSNRSGGAGSVDLYFSTRTDPASPWSMPARIAALSSNNVDAGFTTTPDELIAYFYSNRNGGNKIYRTTRASKFDAWQPPVVLELGGNQYENPWISADDCSLYFSSNRAGSQSNDLWVVRRQSLGGAWGTPELVGGVNSNNFDSDVWLSADQRTIFFSSNRANSFNLYRGTR